MTVLSTLLFLVSCSSDAVGDGGADAHELPGAPEHMWGTYDVRLYGDWFGSCSFMLSTGALIEDLRYEQDGWAGELGGTHHATSITESEGDWTFLFEADVMSGLGPDHQEWYFIIPEGAVNDGGFEGDYQFVSDVSGTFDGTLRGTRQ